MPTLWEILTKKKQEEILELKQYNPLKAKVGTVVNIIAKDSPYLNTNFIVKSVEDYLYLPEKNGNHSCDYNVSGATITGTQNLKIRLVPNADSSIGHDVILLSKYDSMPYDKTFHDEVLGSKTLQFDINLENEVLSFWRINDVELPYKVRVTLLKDTDGDGKVEKEEIYTSNVTVWDYWRDVVVKDEVIGREFLYVEMTNSDKFFTIWRGTTVAPQDIIVF